MSSVTIKSHPELIDRHRKAIMTPSEFGHFSISSKAVYHIMTHSNIDIISAISSGSFTDVELFLTQTPDVVFMPIRTSLMIEDIDLYDELEESDDARKFIIPLYLQTKSVEIRNVNMNMTGNFLYTFHPLNLYLSNITIDFGKFGFFHISQDVY